MIGMLDTLARSEGTNMGYPQLSSPPARDEMIGYGDSPDAVMPVAWAEHILTALATERPRDFKRLIGEAAAAHVNTGQ